IGDTKLSDMDAKLAAAASRLQYGEASSIVDLNGRSVILRRMPRDFKWQAEQLFQRASALKSRGDLKGAVEKDQEALQVYPYSLRALVLMGTSLERPETRRGRRKSCDSPCRLTPATRPLNSTWR